jgi:two-component system cell cycle sensor histidine kinase/response regulator CckA
MATPLSVLILEDNPSDAELVLHSLRRSGYDPIADRVETERDYRDHLQTAPEIILSDFTMPGFDSVRALSIMQECGLDIPVIVVSGTIGEERAVQIMQLGAADYVMKDRLGRLGHAVAQALEKKQLRDEKRLASDVQRRSTQLLTLSADVGMALTTGKTLAEMLRLCVESMVRNLGAALARIWIAHAGTNVLELQASAGIYTHLDGPHSQVTFGEGDVGFIAQEQTPHLANDVLNDNRVSDREWARREGMVAFAGYPMLLEDRLVGVVAVFARTTLCQERLDALAAVANQIAVGVERKRSEESLRQSNQTLHALIQTTPLAMITLDQRCHVTMWNPAAEEMFGWKASEVLGEPLPIVPPDQKEAFDRSIHYEHQPDRATSHELHLCHKTGALLEVQLWTAPVTDANGAIVGSTGLFVNVTESKRLLEQSRRAAEAVRQSEARKDAILRMSLDAIMTMDREGTILSFNPAAERIFGYLEKAAIGISVDHLLIPPVANPPHKDGPGTSMKSGMGFVLDKRLEMPGVRADGSAFPAELTITRIPLDGAPLFTGFVQDITDRKCLEEQLRQSQKMEAVGQLAAGVAHDFNNLLTIILGYSELILRKLPAGDPDREPTGQIRKAGERAAALTRQLLAFGRKQILSPVVLDLNSLVIETEKMLRRLIGADIELSTILQPGLGRVKVDSGQLEQVMMNLVVNARDAMPTGGRLTVQTHNTALTEAQVRHHADLPPGPYALLAVTDTGTGMAEETKMHIFEPFFTTKEVGKGTGLGLATVFGIIKQSGGFIEVDSALGSGSTFRIFLPQIGDAAQLKNADHGQVKMPTGGETVLLVEDEDGVRELAQLILEASGYTVLSARDGGEALQVSHEYAKVIDLLFTDVVMPKMSGRQLSDLLVPYRPNMKVLFMSGYTDDTIVRHGIQAAETNFLPKPFTPVALAQKVREALDGTNRQPETDSPLAEGLVRAT